MSLLKQYIELKTKFNLTADQVKAVNLIEQGTSLEEIFYQSKEQGLDVLFWQLDLFETLSRDFQELEKKKIKIISDIEHQGVEEKDQVIDEIKVTLDGSKLDELYRPYKRRKKTKATLAREAGLAELADWILDVAYGKTTSDVSLEVKAKEYLKPALGFVTYEIVLKGAQDIIVDRLLKKPEIRKELSDLYHGQSLLKIEKTDKFKNPKYNSLLSFKEKVSSLLESKNYYKFPMVKKAWEEGQVKVLLEVDTSSLVEKLKSETLKLSKENPWAGFVNEAFQKMIDIHVIPSITQEIVEELLSVSEKETIKRLKQDYQKLLMTPAFGDKTILSFTQIKDDQIEMALVTDMGELVSATSVITAGDSAKAEFISLIQGITKQIDLGALAIGLGPYARKVEGFILDCYGNDIKALPAPIAFVDTRGLSSYVHQSYEADKTKTKMEHTLLTLARRMQDPLLELSKYTPKSLLDIPNYVSIENLNVELIKILKHCVALVGLDLNKANRNQLELIAGLDAEMIEKIISYRLNKSRFVEKQQLRTELNMSEDQFDVCSCFLKVMISKSILDHSHISGKDFPAIKDFLKEFNLTPPLKVSADIEETIYNSKWKTIFGESKLKFIVKELKAPYADPRRTYKFFGFSDKLKNIDDIKVGWNYPGLVTKFSSFGVFVEIGVLQEGLIHLSELSNEYISDPRKVVGLGDWIYVNVIDYAADKKLISLSKIKAEKNNANTKHRNLKKNFKPRASDESIEINSKSRGSESDGSARKSRDQSNNRNGAVRSYGPKNTGKNNGHKKDDYKKSKSFDKKSNSRRNEDKNKKSKQPFNNPFAALSNLNIKE